MKKAKTFIKNNIKLLIGLIIGIIISAGGVYAAIVIQGTSVGYTDNYSLGATTVQAAIDKLYTMANNQYFDYTTAKADITGKVFASKKGVCINRNRTVYCFKLNNWETEKTHLQQVFSDVSCTVNVNSVNCSASDFFCEVYLNGSVTCRGASSYPGCYISSDGSGYCA